MDFDDYKERLFDFKSEINEHYFHVESVDFSEAICSDKILKYSPSFFIKKFLKETNGDVEIKNCHYEKNGTFWINYSDEAAVGTSGYIYNFKKNRFYYYCTEMEIVYNDLKQSHHETL